MKIRDEADHQGVTEALREWRQGDCVVGNQGFLYRSDPTNPLTRARALAAESAGAAEVEVSGFMVVTQTCDIVRHSGQRPFVEVSPLVRVDEQKHHEIERMRRPNYAFIASLAGDRLVADLDRVMTIEKSVVTRWNRVHGCPTNDDRRRLSVALVRNRARFAFPDDFTRCTEPLLKRILSRHDRNTNEGRTLRAIDEIRVHAAPSWEAGQIKLDFLFIRKEEVPELRQQDWDDQLGKWLALVRTGGRFVDVGGLIATPEDLTAREYMESDPLDFDHLSTRGE